MSDFIPKNYVRLPRVLVELAEARDVSAWTSPEIGQVERAIWQKIKEGRLYAQALAPWLLGDVDAETREAFKERWFSYLNAEAHTRKELHAGSVIATCIVEGRASDIEPEFWGTEGGDFVLGDGMILVHGAVHRDRYACTSDPAGIRLPVLLRSADAALLITPPVAAPDEAQDAKASEVALVQLGPQAPKLKGKQKVYFDAAVSVHGIFPVEMPTGELAKSIGAHLRVKSAEEQNAIERTVRHLKKKFREERGGK